MIRIEAMRHEHLQQAYDIECDCFAVPWSYDSFAAELDNPHSIYIVATADGAVVGFAGMHHIAGEGHVTNIAVARQFRKRGIGDALLKYFLDIAKVKKMTGLTLEVRMGNASALGLYGKYGFKFEGIRKNYYADTKEDAIIMWKYFKPEVAE